MYNSGSSFCVLPRVGVTTLTNSRCPCCPSRHADASCPAHIPSSPRAAPADAAAAPVASCTAGLSTAAVACARLPPFFAFFLPLPCGACAGARMHHARSTPPRLRSITITGMSLPFQRRGGRGGCGKGAGAQRCTHFAASGEAHRSRSTTTSSSSRAVPRERAMLRGWRLPRPEYYLARVSWGRRRCSRCCSAAPSRAPEAERLAVSGVCL